jgi:hypothetical protein
VSCPWKKSGMRLLISEQSLGTVTGDPAESVYPRLGYIKVCEVLLTDLLSDCLNRPAICPIMALLLTAP